MDSNAVVLNFLHHNIINRGDQRRITKTEDPTEQNEFLHLYLKEKCTEDAFHLVCDIISGVKGNPKMSALGTAMKRRLATGNCVCVCACVCACVCVYVRTCLHVLARTIGVSHECVGNDSCAVCGEVLQCTWCLVW